MFIFIAVIISLGFILLSPFFNTHSHHHYSLPSHPIIGCLVAFYKNSHRLLDWYTEHLSQSPTQTIVVHRLGARRTIVTANPCNVEYILKTNFHNFPKGKPFTDILGDLLGCGIFVADGELWSTQRKLASHEFSTRSLRDFTVKILQEEVREKLYPLLEHASAEGHVIDLQDILRRLTFDTVCKVTLGNDPCCLDLSKPLPPLLVAFDEASEISAMRGMAPVFLTWKIKRLLNIGSERALREAVKLVHESVLDMIRRKIKETAKQEQQQTEVDLLTRLLKAGHEEVMVRDMLISMIMAGRDTTSAAMTWLFWLLTRHRKHEEAIVKGVREVCGEEEGWFLDYERLKEMKFLKACVCESMRLYPPVAWDSKHAIRGDVLPDGTKVERGDRVTYFPYGMGRMEALWGSEFGEFKPKRWLDENGSSKLVSPYKFPVFQAGPRVCLGKEMAFIQMEYVVASILNRFVINPVSLDHPVFVPRLTAHMAGGFKVRVHRRQC
ncbi:cytochrome P450 94B3-like [Abrus precatorius]|uniref:Cytochrome P450 94B3-like n=1 Tax=Abrus precatorius TaxID=3816 RepID=A0A8B8KRV8_ABRPR|nr:cytochrome P450 94B3-like [Abrus precatorius]